MGAVSVTSDEMRILEEALRRYPVTVEELRASLGMRAGAFELALRSLVRKHLVELEPLDDRTYVRPLAMTGGAPPARPSDADDPSYR